MSDILSLFVTLPAHVASLYFFNVHMQGFLFFFVNVCICFAAFVHFYISEEMCLFLPK